MLARNDERVGQLAGKRIAVADVDTNAVWIRRGVDFGIADVVARAVFHADDCVKVSAVLGAGLGFGKVEGTSAGDVGGGRSRGF